MSYATRQPAAARELLDQGWIYVDVRTVEEFDAGHPVGAYNVPLLLRDASGGMTPNPNFAAVLGKAFARDAKLVIGCRSGQRSMKACEVAASLGFASLVNMAGGFVGATDMFGRVKEAGWQACGLPCAQRAESGRSWRELSAG
ncbi:MAG: rhodanese-like domain-containing protein [Planctomycetes bacterium]|nr:rhodanese-like domain-containing protein [Planctomycetota bacterium]